MDSVFSTDTLLHSTHQFLLEKAPSFPYMVTWNVPEKIREILSEVQERINLLLTDHTLLKEGEQLLRIMELVRCELYCVVENKEGSNLDRLLSFRAECHSSKQLILIKQWGSFFIQHRKNKANYFFHLSALDLEIAKAARREENFDLAKTYLSKVLLIGEPKAPNVNLDTFISSMDFSGSRLTAEKAACIRQCAKISYKWRNKQSAVNYLTSLVGGISHNFPADSFHSLYFEVCSRSLHTMAKWFRDDPSLIEQVYPDTANKITLDHVLAVEQQAIMHHLDFLPMVESASDNDMVVGRLLRLSVIQSPQLAKLWNSFADWALDMGEKFLASCERESIGITEEERQFIMELVPEATVSQFEEIFQLLQHYRLQHSEKGEIELNRLEYMKKELRSCSGLAGCSNEIIEHINKIWAAMQKRTFFFHETAIRAYFQFIMQSDGVQEDKLIAATLRILQLTVKHSLELQECLQEGLEATPSGNWRAIIPQLFSRLNHPVRIVRARISELLCRIAQDYPHMIIYPAVVGAASSKKDKFARLLTQPVDEVQEGVVVNGGSSSPVPPTEEEEEDSQGMRGAYERIVATMNKQCGPAVEQVQKFVAELQRISVLWDELWLGSLQQHGNEVIRRVGKMEAEVQKLSRNKSLSAEEKKLLVLDKYNIIFKPVLYVFEKVYSLTNKEPETPNEKRFIKKYGPFIANMMKKIRNPANPAKPKESWDLLGQLQNNLTGKLHSKTNLKMSEISPVLHEMKGSEIPMPGIPGKASLKIQHLDGDLTILLTKTKPKRLAFYGSDGRKYSYLFKGLEDLHLDERVMQFLSIANIMMRKSGKEYKARHYSVVPLGPRSGLIQWVGGSVPLYTLYKKWQQRQQMASRKTAAAGGQKKVAPVQKPTDMFYNKLLPILKECGVTNLESRKDWPAAALKQAMTELVDETPDTLISQELWFASSDAQHWFTLMQNLTRSIAVMSVIGYIIGLGDRHLDNLLLDIQKGEVIHIDYNVCFEKGKHLRIPERTPCRLTQNIVRIFGLTGVEGLFRASCEHTLEAMRQGRETLITLLEAFVYDPLVDWTPGVDLAFSGKSSLQSSCLS